MARINVMQYPRDSCWKSVTEWFRTNYAVSPGEYLAVEYRSTLRMLNAGWMFVALIPGIWIMVNAALRELLQGQCTVLGTITIGLITAEAGLFMAIFWSVCNVKWFSGITIQGLCIPGPYIVVMCITVQLSALSIAMSRQVILAGNMQCSNSTAIISWVLTLVLAFGLTLTAEYRGLSLYVDDYAPTSGLFLLTGLHFGHVCFGALLMWYATTKVLSIQSPYAMTSIQLANNVIRVQAVGSGSLLYMHFVEAAWIGIHAVSMAYYLSNGPAVIPTM
nr:PREDICTED: cytochrome c oxidase subunit 3 [Bos mutus]